MVLQFNTKSTIFAEIMLNREYDNIAKYNF